MRTGELVVGAELGEDADHRGADQIAPVRIFGRGDRLLQALERRFVVAGVPSLESAGEHLVGRLAVGHAQPRPGGEALGAKVSPERLQQLQRLPCVTAREQDPAEPGGGLAMARIDRQRLAQRVLVPAGRELVGRRRDERVEPLLEWAGGIAPVNSATTWPSRNAFTAGIPWTPKLADSPWLASTSTFASSTLPARLAIAASSAGVSCRHGPHHSAQKSTTTGNSRDRSTTSVTKSDSLTSLLTAHRD